MRWVLLSKLSFWLVIIGAFALVTPNPAWPEWLARMILAAGVALGITTIGIRWREVKRASRPPGGPEGPDAR